ncbi:MAG: tetratricopeptide repeat protein [Candidatus Riflebacteria bacterium]|nr:tetratricopeptide repeat protein [Candidatus Riflebacteria bacterium]
MHETKEKFYELTAELLREDGVLPNRPTWIKLRQLVQAFEPELLQSGGWSDTHLLLLALLKTAERSPERVEFLSKVLASVTTKTPDEEFILLLKQLSTDDLAKSLFPCMYQADSRGSAAVYLAARAALHLAPEAFQYFLCARLWSQTDLINLSFLVRPNEIHNVCAMLEKAAETEQSAINKEAFSEFRYILFNQSSQQPLLPDIEPSTAPFAEQRQTSESVVPAQLNVKPVATLSQTRRTVTPALQQNAPHKPEQPDKAGLQFPPELVRLVETNRTVFLIIFGLTTLTLLASNFSGWLISDSAPVRSQAEATKIPSHWVDSSSRELITERDLAADKDYRMGELYLTRDKYSEALILFEDALATKPDHIQALYRVGYCRLNIKDFAGAKTSLEKALKIDPAFRHTNLLLARVAIGQNDNRLAEKHFRLELELTADPMIALEYANFLQNLNKEDEANDLISKFQALYPERVLVLSQKPEIKEEQEQQQ